MDGLNKGYPRLTGTHGHLGFQLSLQVASAHPSSIRHPKGLSSKPHLHRLLSPHFWPWTVATVSNDYKEATLRITEFLELQKVQHFRKKALTLIECPQFPKYFVCLTSHVLLTSR